MATHWLIQLAHEMLPLWQARVETESIRPITKTEADLFEVKSKHELTQQELASTVFPRYALPVSFEWPTNIQSDGFVEKAAQGLLKRFGASDIANIQVFSSDTGLTKLASNVRGRTLQLFETLLEKNSKGAFSAWRNDPLSAPSAQPQLHLCLHRKGIKAGLTSPKDCRSWFAGGRRYLQSSEVSRAAAKFIEAEEHLRLCGENLGLAKKWVEFGAAPGGITKELLQRQYQVWAVDRAALDASVNSKNLHFFKSDVSQFEMSESFDALMCDMNGSALDACAAVCRTSVKMRAGGHVIFTLKLAALTEFDTLFEKVKLSFASAGLELLDCIHLFHNRQEVTLLLKKKG